MQTIGIAATKAVARASQHSRSGELSTDKPSTAVRPAFCDRECDIELPRVLLSAYRVDGEPQTVRRALAPIERQKLEQRATVLRAGLSPFDDTERGRVDAYIGAMLGGFRSMRAQGEDVEAIVSVTRHVLRSFPLWAIAEASVQIAQGKAGLDRRFAPNDSEIYAVAERSIRTFRKTLETIEAVLSGPVEPARPARESTAGAAPITPLPDKPIRSAPEDHDGKHAERVAKDLAARRARREMAKMAKMATDAA